MFAGNLGAVARVAREVREDLAAAHILALDALRGGAAATQYNLGNGQRRLLTLFRGLEQLPDLLTDPRGVRMTLTRVVIVSWRCSMSSLRWQAARCDG